MSERRFDVVVAGAGPAGSTLALRIARAGFSVALVEPKRFPRFKPCGDFMSPACLGLLDDLGVLGEVRSGGAREVGGMRLFGYGRSPCGSYRPVEGARFHHGYSIRREVLDDILLRAALQTGGVELFSGWNAVTLLRDDRGTIAGLRAARRGEEPVDLRARFTIGADGLRSRVAECLGVRRAIPWLDKLALTTRWRCADWSVMWTGHAEVHLFDRGFFACAPVDAGFLTLNLVIDRASYRADRTTPEQFLEERLAATPALLDRLDRAERAGSVRGLGPLAFRTTEQIFDGAALVGDACGYVDPVTGEGIYFALRGAELLARNLIESLHERRTDRAALVPYARERRSDVAPRAALALLLQRGMRHPRVVRAALACLEKHPGLMELLVTLTGDCLSPRALARPSTWFQACWPTRNGGRSKARHRVTEAFPRASRLPR